MSTDIFVNEGGFRAAWHAATPAAHEWIARHPTFAKDVPEGIECTDEAMDSFILAAYLHGLTIQTAVPRGKPRLHDYRPRLERWARMAWDSDQAWREGGLRHKAVQVLMCKDCGIRMLPTEAAG